ncbi:putative ABC transport system permease protein [Pseudonocardia hierapolitana]|uniref:Putative ABC transport system permease protein n=1 Tax=Pseudonocardia hierapolitana TaxID=1128676 RepID=A0A561SVG3_9PSEU|nr:FtsX-like permease family protein [Pseudonocardia hierapolitana]TWF78842.1 putative ABC transport system permease protein [Pseudonocardia hierapolitana]
MRTVLLASLRIHVRRYVAAGIAVIASVAFVVVIGVLTAGAKSGLVDGTGSPFRNADHVVSPAVWPGSQMDRDEVIAFTERHGENAAAIGRGRPPAHVDGRPLSRILVAPIASSPEMRWQQLVTGRFPATEGEAVLHNWFAQAEKIAIGDRIRIGEGSGATDVEVVGVVESPAAGAMASAYVTWPQLLRWRDYPLHLGSVAVRGDIRGPLPEGAKVQSPEEFATEREAEMHDAVDTWSLMPLLFAAIAVVVSVLVIANTFSILFAQRVRDFALLRCVGATRRQVLGSVRREAAAVGVLASLTGVLVGVGLGYGLIALINALVPTARSGVVNTRSPVMSAIAPELTAFWPWLLGGFAVGLLVTLLASWLPTRRVVRVSPLAALRVGGSTDAALDARTATGRTRLALAGLGLVAGPVLLGTAMAQDNTVLMLAGGAAVAAGVLLVGPMLVPRLIRIAGAPLGPAGRLATANAVRNPHRTAATTASLLVCVTLTTAVLTGSATMRAASDAERGVEHPIDAALTSSGTPLGADLLDQVRRTPGVEQAIPVDGAVARMSGLDDPIPLLTAPDAAQVARDGGAFAHVEPGEIRIDPHALTADPGSDPIDIGAGDEVTVRIGDREARLRVVVGVRSTHELHEASGWGPAGVVAPDTLARLTDSPQPHAIWVRVTSGTDALQLVGALDELAGTVGAEVDDQLQARAAEDRTLGNLTLSVLGLLGISVAIAVIGIANTLGLSVLERAREHAMLRALGLTRTQLRLMLAAEAMLLSVAATGLGTVIGIGFGWVGYETFVERALNEVPLQVPWLQLGVVVLLAALAGLLAGVLPARRAARVTPAAGLSLD